MTRPPTAILETARAHLDRGALDAARGELESALQEAARRGDSASMARALAETGILLLEAGRPEEAEARLRAAMGLARPLGAWTPRAEGALGEAMALGHRYAEGRAQVLHALERCAAAGGNPPVADEDPGARGCRAAGDPERVILLCRLGRIAARAGDLAEAMAALQDARELHAAGIRDPGATRAIGALAATIDDIVGFRPTEILAAG